MAKLLKSFQEINELPPFLLRRVEQYDISNELAEVFVNTKAIFHKNCLLKYSQLKYERKIKNECKEKEKDDKTPTTTRKKISASNFTGTCFFCNSDETISNLHSCQTLELDKRIRKIALEIGDVKLLAQLCEGDMIATEVKYHRNCLRKLNKRFREHNTKKSEECSKLDIIRGMAFSEVINFVEDTISMSHENTVPVFKLQELKNLYTNKIIYFGVSKEVVESETHNSL